MPGDRLWSHTYTDWSQIEPPLPRGESHCHGLSLDWKRFVTHQTVDFCQKEIEAVREGGSQLPATTNLMGFYKDLNYNKFQDVLDIISWDNYPDCTVSRILSIWRRRLPVRTI